VKRQSLIRYFLKVAKALKLNKHQSLAYMFPACAVSMTASKRRALRRAKTAKSLEVVI
jgi:hypothetical protein